MHSGTPASASAEQCGFDGGGSIRLDATSLCGPDGRAQRRAGFPTSAPGLATSVPGLGPTSAPGLVQICAGTHPRRGRDSSISAPGLARVCAETDPHLHRDWPTFAPRLAHIYICAGTGPHLHLRRDRPHICAATARQLHVWLIHGGVCTTAPHMHRQPRKLRRYVSVFLQMLLDSRADPNAGIDGNGPTVVQASPPAHVPCVVNQILLTAQPSVVQPDLLHPCVSCMHAARLCAAGHAACAASNPGRVPRGSCRPPVHSRR
jgi:hypothetical protein